jgi:hypothetical protein
MKSFYCNIKNNHNISWVGIYKNKMINFKQILIKKHGIPDNKRALDEYIKFIKSYSKDTTAGYSENHHILPKCNFSEYERNPSNIIKLLYEDHVYAHTLLFEAFNIRSYQRPLHWMMTYYKNSKLISNAAKKGWASLKSNKELYNPGKPSIQII